MDNSLKFYTEKLGSLLFKARFKMGYSQLYMAQKIGVSQKTYSYYESGKRTPDLIQFIKIAHLTEINPIEIIEKLFKGEPSWKSLKAKEHDLSCEIEKLNTQIFFLQSLINLNENTINKKLDRILENWDTLKQSQ